MPDISMCTDEECPSRLQCYRYRAEPNTYRQSYMKFPRHHEAEKCDSFWPLREAPTKLKDGNAH